MENEAIVIFCECKAALIRLCTLDSVSRLQQLEFAKLERKGFCKVRLPINAANLIPYCECPDGVKQIKDDNKQPNNPK